MPLNLPDKLPAIELLKEENIFVIDNSRANAQDIRPLKIVILNLMPIKVTTETDLIRLLSNTPLQLEISFMKLKSHTSKNTPIEHMKAFYRDFEKMRPERFDGMIVTGAPVEQMDFGQVNYWPEITEVFDWARTHVTSTLYICWAAQAGMYHFYGVTQISVASEDVRCVPSSRERARNGHLPRLRRRVLCAPQPSYRGAPRGHPEGARAATAVGERRERRTLVHGPRRTRDLRHRPFGVFPP